MSTGKLLASKFYKTIREREEEDGGRSIQPIFYYLYMYNRERAFVKKYVCPELGVGRKFNSVSNLFTPLK